LKAKEKQRLEVIQIYPQLKMGEIWCEIQEELADFKIRPTSDDLHWMLTSIEEFEELVLNCVNTQKMVFFWRNKNFRSRERVKNIKRMT
jgi:hypothetical protein